MRIVVTLPSRLTEPVRNRFGARQSTAEILLVRTDAGESVPPMQDGDGLLMLQPVDFALSQQAASVAGESGVHYGEVALVESPLAGEYGFMVAAGGKAADLHALAPELNALAPCPYGWWHVGEAGSAAFLLALYTQLGAAAKNPFDISNPFPHLAQIAATQQQSGVMAADYLAQTEGEHFVAALPDRQRALFAFTSSAESPARQIARLIRLFCQPPPAQAN